MLRTPLAAVLLICVAAHADEPATAPATKPNRAAPTERELAAQEIAGLAKRPTTNVGEFFDVGVEDDFLFVRPKRPVDGPYTVTFSDWPGFVSVQQFQQPGAWSFKHNTLAKNDTVQTITQLGTTVNTLNLSRDSESPTRLRSIQLIQNRGGSGGDPVQLLISDAPQDDKGDGAVAPQTRLTALTFSDLCREHPVEVREHLLPIFTDMGAAAVLKTADTARAWQVLGNDVPADPAMAARVDALLKRLEADDFADRAKAEDELAALGPAGATELRRRDDTKFAPDVRSAVENARRRAEPLPPAQAKHFKSDVPFLLETLRLGNAALAAAAARQLSTVTGKPLDLPADLPAAERDRRIDAYAMSVAATKPKPMQDEGP